VHRLTGTEGGADHPLRPPPLGEVVGRREEHGRDLVAVDHRREAVADVDEQDPREDVHAVVLDELAVLRDGGGVVGLIVLRDQLDPPPPGLKPRLLQPQAHAVEHVLASLGEQAAQGRHEADADWLDGYRRGRDRQQEDHGGPGDENGRT